MKKPIAFIVVACVVLCVATYWIYDHRVSTNGQVQQRPPKQAVQPPSNKALEDSTAGVPLDDLPKSLESGMESDSKMQIAITKYQQELAKEREEVDGLIDKYQDAALEEIPQDFRLKMRPQDGETSGRFISYVSDGIEKYLCDDFNGIHDYGEFHSIISHDAPTGSFRQEVKCGEAKGMFKGRGMILDKTPLPTVVLQWKESGAIEYVSKFGEPPEPFFPDVECFADKQLKKGDTAVRLQKVGKAEVEITSTVLGYVEAEGRKMVVFEETVPLEVRSGSRDLVIRMYYDIETSIPVRVEKRNITHFSEEYMKKRETSKYPHSTPLSGEKHIVSIYQAS